MKKIIVIIMLLLTSMLLANTYSVMQNGNGDFTTIQSAVNNVSADDEIIVYDGTYYEDITINTSNLTLKSVFGPEDCIIDGDVHCIRVNTGIEKIEGFTFIDASCGAVYLEYGVDELINCVFEDNESCTGGYIPNASAIMSGLPIGELSGCIFENNEGEYTVSLYGDYPVSQTEYETVKNNLFINNSNTERDISILNVSSDYHGIIENNTFKGSSGGIYVHQLMLYGNADINIRNCVFDAAGIDDDNNYNASNKIIITYCSFTGSGYQSSYNWGDGNLTNTDPELHSITYQPQWLSSVKSPCIDSGDPSISNDNDGTPPDIGAVSAISHQIDEIELPPASTNSGWKWLSFPALDTILDDADVAENVLDDILDVTILDKVIHQDYTIEWNGSIWLNDWQQFLRTEGFKFHMNDDYDLDVPGFKEPDNTEITLAGSGVENWIGYWLEDTQEVSDAFEDYWDGSNIYYIQSQFWTAHYNNGAWQTTTRVPTLSYGDMVIVKCRTTISDFEWNTGAPTERTVFADPEYFSYSEQADYIPLYIEVGVDIPQEIGVIVNGECIGATVVEDIVNQINVYTTSTLPGNIELELYYGNRNENKVISSYKCVSSSSPNTILSQISTEHYADSWYVDLREGYSITPSPENLSLDNYPNPFNPTTTISYSLPSDGKVDLDVYNIKGQLVTTLVSGNQLSGTYEVVWNGKDKNENKVSSGIYFYKLSTKDETTMKKMLLLK